MTRSANEFNTQLELDVLLNGLTEITQDYVRRFAYFFLTDVVIPEGVKSIENGAFEGCTDLKRVTIPNTVTHIKEWAFGCCDSLKTVKISNSVTNIEDYAFYSCHSLRTIKLPNSVKRIGQWSFEFTGLTSITIPKSVTSMGYWALYGCKCLSTVTFKGKTLDEVHAMEYYPWGLSRKASVQVS